MEPLGAWTYQKSAIFVKTEYVMMLFSFKLALTLTKYWWDSQKTLFNKINPELNIYESANKLCKVKKVKKAKCFKFTAGQYLGSVRWTQAQACSRLILKIT